MPPKIEQVTSSRVIADVWSSWRGVFNKDVKFHWFDIDIIRLTIENDIMMGAYELSGALLGFGFRFRYNKKEETEMMKELNKRVDEIRVIRPLSKTDRQFVAKHFKSMLVDPSTGFDSPKTEARVARIAKRFDEAERVEIVRKKEKL